MNMINKLQQDSSTMFSTLTLEQPQQGTYLLTINRPEVLNALNCEVLDELAQAVHLINDDPSARVLLLTGSGDKSFVAGADIAEMSTLSPLEGKAFSQRGMKVFRSLEQMKIPVIALVNGYALGGGCELAMSCDFILASNSACFGQPEVSLGITPGFGGSQRLTRLVGRAMAMELLMSGRPMKAKEAAQRGLINHTYPQDELLNQGLKLAAIICSNSSNAIQLTKELVQRGQDLDLENACVMESDLFGLSFATDHRQQGMKAFLENKKTAFS